MKLVSHWAGLLKLGQPWWFKSNHLILTIKGDSMKKHTANKSIGHAFLLIKIGLLGEDGDRVIGSADTEQEIVDYCEKKNLPLRKPVGWSRYFIKRVQF